MMETMIPPQLGMRLRAKKKRGKSEAKKCPRTKKKKEKKKWEKRQKGHANTTLVLQSSTMFFI